MLLRSDGKWQAHRTEDGLLSLVLAGLNIASTELGLGHLVEKGFLMSTRKPGLCHSLTRGRSLAR